MGCDCLESKMDMLMNKVGQLTDRIEAVARYCDSTLKDFDAVLSEVKEDILELQEK